MPMSPAHNPPLNNDKDPYSGIRRAGLRGTVEEKDIVSNARFGDQEHPEPHVHVRKHRVRGMPEETRKDNNEYHNDEAFEEFQMGKYRMGKEANEKTGKNSAMSSYQATKQNHHARGTAKTRAEEGLHENDAPI